MLKKIISGGQSGADIAGIDAAIANDFPYGGWIPKGRRTENGPLPERYQLDEMPSRGYPKRTKQNVKDSDGTVIVVHGTLTGGSDLTRKYAVMLNKPWLHINLDTLSVQEAVQFLAEWVQRNKVEVLNVAGRSASKDPEIYATTFTVVDAFLKKIKRGGAVR